MPIRFEQPGPIDAAASQGAGAAAQFSRDLPAIQSGQHTLASLYEAAARLRRPAVGVDMRPGGGDVHGGGSTAYDPHPYPYQQPDPLTQAEQLRLQRLQNARSLIQDQVNSGQLSQQDGNLLLLQAQSGIDPLKQRQEKAMAQMREQQAQLMMHEHARTSAMDNMSEDERAQHVQQQLVPVNSPTGEFMGFARIGRDGRMDLVQPRPGGPQQSRLDPLASRMLTDQQRSEMENLTAHHRGMNDAALAWQQGEVQALGETPLPAERRSLLERHRRDNHERVTTHRDEINALRQQHRQQFVRALAGGNPYQEDQPTPTQNPGRTPPAQAPPAGTPSAVTAAFDALQRRLLSPQQPAAPTDPGMVRGEPEQARGVGGVGAFNPGVGPMEGRVYLARSERPERPNDPGTVSDARTAALARRVAETYNRTNAFSRRFGRGTQALGTMADILLNAEAHRRGLTRHEEAAYRRLQPAIRGFDNADEMALGD